MLVTVRPVILVGISEVAWGSGTWACHLTADSWKFGKWSISHKSGSVGRCLSVWDSAEVWNYWVGCRNLRGNGDVGISLNSPFLDVAWKYDYIE
mgnify:CR=1 FL=1